jgi:hypothetical protein
MIARQMEKSLLFGVRAEERFRLAQLAPGAKIPLTLNLRPGDYQAGVDKTVVRITGARAP